jgi:hydroxyacylglutathione hydrolase
MLLKYFYDRALAQASYMVACQKCGEAIIIDPARDVTPYLEAARIEGMRIAHVTETHIHADFVSGARELAHQTGAKLYLSGEGGPDWLYRYDDGNIQLLKNGDVIAVGEVRLDVIHTPGHTPEHLIFQLTDTAGANRPMGLFTGDLLFVGDIGRPDLLETAAGIMNTKEAGALDQFDNLRLLEALPDFLQIWPGHGAGSACGKSLGAVPSSTLGYEKLFNPAFQIEDVDRFVDWLLDGQPETPRYFAQMKHVNREGPALLGTLSPVEPLEGFILPEAVKDGLVIDTRSAEAFAVGHHPNTINILPTDKFSTYAGWVVDFSRPVYLIAETELVERLVRELRAIGVDNIPGYFTPARVENYFTQTLELLSPEAAAAQIESGNALLLDVRNASELESERIDGAQHIMYGLLPDHLDELPTDKPIIVHCASGVRSQLAASLLQTHGFTKVASMDGGLDDWKAAGLPIITR